MLLAAEGPTNSKLTAKQQDAAREKKESYNNAFQGLFGGKAKSR